MGGIHSNPLSLTLQSLGTGAFSQATQSGGAGVAGLSYSGTNVGRLGEDNYGVRGVNGAGSGRALPLAAVVGDSGPDPLAAGPDVPDTGHGVYGVSKSPGTDPASFGVPYSGVMGLHSGNGTGVTGLSNTGFGILAISSNNHAIYAQSDGDPATYSALYAQGSVNVTADLNVGGDINLTGDLKLAPTATDCAEEFDTADALAIEPGTVVVIDDEGALRESREAYDRKVAGVVSGAGECRPAIVLGKRRSNNPRAEVALVGKVYCKVDAQYAPIQVGDLLTTSATSGHAMRAQDPFRAFGAVIGKALRPLQGGQGLIPILIALQ
jgi:hypothetical protein